MIRTLCWKEWREQRGSWLLVAAATTALVAGIGLTFAPAGLAAIPSDRSLSYTLQVLIESLAVAYGLVSGARLLAGERESGTLDFLDVQPGRRGRLWFAKVLTGGAFAVAQAVVLAALVPLIAIQHSLFSTWHGFVVLPILVLDGFAWGLAGSALARNVFGAALLGGAMTGCSWLVTLALAHLSGGGPALLASRVLFGAAAAAVSYRLFTRRDRQRSDGSLESAGGRAPWRALVWLTYRQGRGEAALLLAAGLVLGAVLPLADVMLWPLTVVVLVSICGAAAFAEDSAADTRRCFSDLRLPPWLVWSVRAGIWLVWAWVVTLASSVGMIVLAAADRIDAGRVAANLYVPPLFPGTSLALVLGTLVLHGFAAGLLAGMVLRRRVVAELIAATLGVTVAAVWLPSLLCGGVDAWQVLVPPLVLLGATRAAYWPWASGRLGSWRPAVGLTAAVAVAGLLTAVGLLGRVWAIPDVGEPFDRMGFERSLADIRTRPAGPQLREAARDYTEARQRASNQLAQADGADGGPFVRLAEQLEAAIHNGWPEKAPELEKYLDAMFPGPWAEKMRAAAALPLGLVQDPLALRLDSRYEHFNEIREAASLFVARAAQLQARGEDGAALDELLVALGLSRHLRHKAPLMYALGAAAIEGQALAGFEAWLARVGPRPELLRRALDGVTRHERETPPPAENVKAEYFIQRNVLDDLGRPGKTWESQLHALAREVPWEKEREERILRRLFRDYLRDADNPAQAARGIDPETGREAHPWVGVGLRTRWSRMVIDSAPLPWLWNHLKLCTGVRALRQQLALALYEIDQGKPAPRLDALVPRYLEAVPLDPYTEGSAQGGSAGRPFGYRVSQGEKLELPDPPGGTRTVAAGQGVLWSVGPDRRDGGGVRVAPDTLHPAAAADGRPRDLIYLVPRWPKR